MKEKLAAPLPHAEPRLQEHDFHREPAHPAPFSAFSDAMCWPPLLLSMQRETHREQDPPPTIQ
ncbi:MAG TPA: hypothetical protein VFK48_00270 [Usitatibacter sp.]|nr:hypothetical protein [Usitatibacter sp.]